MSSRHYQSSGGYKHVSAGLTSVGATVQGQATNHGPTALQDKGALEYSAHPEKELLWGFSCTAFFRLRELLLFSAVNFNPTLHFVWGEHGSRQYSIPTDT